MQLCGIACNMDCSEANTKYLEAAENAVCLSDRNNGVGGRAKGRSNGKGIERADHILATQPYP